MTHDSRVASGSGSFEPTELRITAIRYWQRKMEASSPQPQALHWRVHSLAWRISQQGHGTPCLSQLFLPRHPSALPSRHAHGCPSCKPADLRPLALSVCLPQCGEPANEHLRPWSHRLSPHRSRATQCPSAYSSELRVCLRPGRGSLRHSATLADGLMRLPQCARRVSLLDSRYGH